MTAFDWDITGRILNIVLGVVAGLAVLAVVWAKKPRSPEALGMVAGALVCLAVAFGSFGFLMRWPAVWYLPFMAAALAYVAVGRLWQLRNMWRGARGVAEPDPVREP